MDRRLGDLLKELRSARQWSVRTLAAQARVSKSALSDWETGKNQPRLPELEAALEALGASAAQRRQCLALLEAPRGVRLLREEMQRETDVSAFDSAPFGGDLLRVMRLRRNATLEEVAAQLGVQSSTVSRWEHGDSWPTDEHLHALCYALKAAPQELIALVSGKFAFAACLPQTMADGFSGVISRLVFFSHSPEQEALKDLWFLSLIMDLWPDASRRGAASDWLIPVYARYGQYLVERGRFREAQSYIERAFDRSREKRSPDPFWLCAGNMAAKIAVYSGRQPRPAEGVRLLRGWLDHLDTLPESRAIDRAWAMSDLAEYLAMEGMADAAVQLARQAYQTTQEYDTSGHDTSHRQHDLARLLLQVGRAGEALQTLLAGGTAERPDLALQAAVLEAEVRLALGERSATAVCLQRAKDLLETHSLHHQHNQVAALVLKLQGVQKGSC